MKVYILTQDDMDALLSLIDRDPEHGYKGGSSNAMSEHDKRIYHDAHRFFNYQVRTWIDKVTK